VVENTLMMALIPGADRDYADVAGHLAGRDPGLNYQVAPTPEPPGHAIRIESPVAIIAVTSVLRGVREVEAVRALSSAALIVLSHDLRDTAVLMEAGADYVLPQPHPPAVLNATTQAVLCRRHAERRGGGRVGEVGPLVAEPSRRSARIEGRRHFLSLREPDLREYRARNVPVVLSRRQIIEGAWGGGPSAIPAAVTMCVHRLRLKLESNPNSPLLLRIRRGNGHVLQSSFTGGA